ncbi:DUF167 domain-containing protein [Thermodesulfovibrio hydrogeniphilus]
MEVPFLKDKDGYFLKIFVKPGAKTSGIEEIEGDTIKIKVRSQPHDGLANKELLEVLAEFLSVPKSKIEIARGKTSKHKIIRIKGEIS